MSFIYAFGGLNLWNGKEIMNADNGAPESDVQPSVANDEELATTQEQGDATTSQGGAVVQAAYPTGSSAPGMPPGNPGNSPVNPSGAIDPKMLIQAQMMVKNTGLAIALALIFGGFGLLYVSIPIGIVCAIVDSVLLLLCVVTAGIGFLILFPVLVVWHLFCVILSLVLASRHNKKLLAKF